VPQPTPERVLDADGVALRDQRPGDHRAAERVVGRGREALDLVVNGHPERPQPLEHQGESAPALVALGAERGLECLVVRPHSEPQDVQLALPEPLAPAGDGVDLDARNQLEPRRGERGGGFPVAGEAVVVGDREEANAGRGGLARELGRLEHAVGAASVGVKVDRGRRRRDDGVPRLVDVARAQTSMRR
jgi:hypothetical protein